MQRIWVAKYSKQVLVQGLPKQKKTGNVLRKSTWWNTRLTMLILVVRD